MLLGKNMCIWYCRCFIRVTLYFWKSNDIFGWPIQFSKNPYMDISECSCSLKMNSKTVRHPHLQILQNPRGKNDTSSTPILLEVRKKYKGVRIEGVRTLYFSLFPPLRKPHFFLIFHLVVFSKNE